MENTVRFFLNECSFLLNAISLGNQLFVQRKWILGPASEVIFRRYLCAGWVVSGVGEPHLLLWAFNQLGIQGGSLNMLTDKNQNSFHPPLHPPTPPIRCSIYEHMFSSLWEQQVWVEPAPVRNRTGRGGRKNVSQWLGTCQDPACWSEPVPRVIGTGGCLRWVKQKQELWGAFTTSPFFPCAPPPHRTVEPEWLAPYHHGVAVRVALALPVRLASRRNRAQLQGPPLLWTEIKDNYFTDKADIPTWIRADIFEKMKEMKARTRDAGHALFFPL